MIESIEHLGAELKFEALGNLDDLDKAKICVPVVRGDKDISACAVGAGNWHAESYVRICAARVGVSRNWIKVDRLEQHWSSKGLIRQVLELRRYGADHAGT